MSIEIITTTTPQEFMNEFDSEYEHGKSKHTEQLNAARKEFEDLKKKDKVKKDELLRATNLLARKEEGLKNLEKFHSDVTNAVTKASDFIDRKKELSETLEFTAKDLDDLMTEAAKSPKFIEYEYRVETKQFKELVNGYDYSCNFNNKKFVLRIPSIFNEFAEQLDVQMVARRNYEDDGNLKLVYKFVVDEEPGEGMYVYFALYGLNVKHQMKYVKK